MNSSINLFFLSSGNSGIVDFNSSINSSYILSGTYAIEQAEHFIYIENQFASREEIAEALNRRMKQKPELKVLIVSSYDPKGTMECEAYWAGRIDFKAILEQGLDSHRVVLTHSSMLDDQGERALKRVHSKVMTIDDRYLVIGSSNLSNRSMALDTECDLIFAGDTEAHRESIRRVRDDLIAGDEMERAIEFEKRVAAATAENEAALNAERERADAAETSLANANYRIQSLTSELETATAEIDLVNTEEMRAAKGSEVSAEIARLQVALDAKDAEIAELKAKLANSASSARPEQPGSLLSTVAGVDLRRASQPPAACSGEVWRGRGTPWRRTRPRLRACTPWSWTAWTFRLTQRRISR